MNFSFDSKKKRDDSDWKKDEDRDDDDCDKKNEWNGFDSRNDEDRIKLNDNREKRRNASDDDDEKKRKASFNDSEKKKNLFFDDSDEWRNALFDDREKTRNTVFDRKEKRRDANFNDDEKKRKTSDVDDKMCSIFFFTMNKDCGFCENWRVIDWRMRNVCEVKLCREKKKNFFCDRIWIDDGILKRSFADDCDENSETSWKKLTCFDWKKYFSWSSSVRERKSTLMT